MFQFYWPWFALLLPLPIFFTLFGRNNKRDMTPEIRFPGVSRLKKAFPAYYGEKAPTPRWIFSLLFLVWVFLVLALMQPERVNQFTQVKNKGYDLMLAVDISASMQAVDFSTKLKTINRLDATKEVVSEFVLGRQGDRVGLITFGENAYLHVPLTLDTFAVSKTLNDTVSGMAGNGTAIGDAIGLSVRTLRDRPEGSRVLVLLTDGADNSSRIPPLEAAKLAKQYGIKIYTIGVGSQGPVPFPSKFGGYGMVEVSMDEELLKQISVLTDGQYFHARDQKALKLIYEKINELEKTEANSSIYFIREPLYRYPLIIGMGFLILLTFISLLNGRKVHGY